MIEDELIAIINNATPPGPPEPSEFIVNGDFATDTDWTKGAGVTIGGGVCTFPASASTLTGTLVQAVASGNSYRLRFTSTGFPEDGEVQLVGAVTQNLTSFGAGSYDQTFVATSANTGIVLKNSVVDGGAGTIDNVSLVPA